MRYPLNKHSVNKSFSNASNRGNDASVHSIMYKCVTTFLNEQSVNPQKLSLQCGQSNGKKSVSISVEEISKENAISMTDSKHFVAAFQAAENRISLKKACNQAKAFYMEHIMEKNPFPPRQKFPIDAREIRKSMKVDKKVEDNSTHSPSRLSSVISFTTMSSSQHSIVSLKDSRVSANFKQNEAKKPKRLRVTDSIYISHQRKSESKSNDSSTKKTSSISSSDEGRMLNTYNTSE